MQNKGFRRKRGSEGVGSVFEGNMVENFPNLEKTDAQVQEAYMVPNRATPRHIIIQMAKLQNMRHGSIKM